MFKELKALFLKKKNFIEVDDLGAGSKKLNRQRSIQQIAKISGSNDKYGKLLFRLVAHYQPKNVLELGTSLGLGTFMLAAGSSDVNVTTVEGCKNTYEVARRSFPSSQHHKEEGCKNTYEVARRSFPSSQHHKVQFVNSSFVDFLKNLEKKQVFDMIFIDGDHKSDSLFEQLKILDPHIHDETIIVLDDIRWSKNMLNAWQKLTLNKNYHLTIDLFKMGIIAKRSHQEKEHFVIRY